MKIITNLEEYKKKQFLGYLSEWEKDVLLILLEKYSSLLEHGIYLHAHKGSGTCISGDKNHETITPKHKEEIRLIDKIHKKENYTS